MDDWFHHFALRGTDNLEGQDVPVDGSSLPDAWSASEWTEHDPTQFATPITDDEIWTPTYLLSGAIAVTGGSLSGRLEAVARVRQLLGANLEGFAVLSEQIRTSEITLSFQAATARRYEDWTLEAISAACHQASSPDRAATDSSVTASVVSLRTKRQTTA